MKSIFITALLLLATSFLPACAGREGAKADPAQSAPSTAGPGETDEQALIRIEGEWGDAMTKHDMVALDRILGDDHTVISKDGRVHTKAEELANYKSEESSNELSDFEPMNVRVFSDTAVVTGGQREKSVNFGKNTSGFYRWTDVFVKRDGRWQAVASELTRVEEKKL
jgi:hypothetical protein